MTAQKRKLNIFQVLGKLGNKDREFYDALSEAERKEVHPLVISRWLSGTTDPAQIMLLNEFVNPYVFSLYEHKKLMVNLLTCSTTSSSRCKWIKSKGKRTPKQPTIVKVIRDSYGYNSRDAINAAVLLTDDDILELATHQGYQPDEIKLIKKELKGR